MKAAIKRAFLKVFIDMTQLRIESASLEANGETSVLSTYVVPSWSWHHHSLCPVYIII